MDVNWWLTGAGNEVLSRLFHAESNILQAPVGEVDKANKMEACVMHVSNSKERITIFSKKSWLKFTTCVKEWVNLQGLEKDVAAEAISRYIVLKNL